MEDKARVPVAHPDQTSPMTVGPEAFLEDNIGLYEQMLRDAVEPFLDWMEQREAGAHIQEVRDGLIGVEDVLPDDHVVLGAHPRGHKDYGVITIGHFRKLHRAYDGEASPAPISPPAVPGEEEPHTDDLAVDRFAAAMKAKLAEKRAQGYHGWDDPEDCTIEHLSNLLVKHVGKGDPVDVGNFAMMIHQRGERIK